MTSDKFYRVLADPAARSRWYMKSPFDPAGHEVDPRQFAQGLRVAPQPPLTLALRQHGAEVSFNFCDFDMVVTPAQLNAELEALAGAAIQRIPVTFQSRRNDFEILNVCDLVHCIDESKSLLTKWTLADGRPDKTGQFRMIAKLKINATLARGHHIFRIAGWPIALIVSGQVKDLLEARKTSGVVYERVD